MNTIIKKIQADEAKEKREAKRKPLCANLDKVCTFKICRCGYSNILDKKAKSAIKKSIDENIHHKVKAGDRRREIELQKLDNEIDWTEIRFSPCPYGNDECPKCVGTHSIKREQDKKIKRAIWWFVGVFIALPMLYIIAIAIYDLF